MAGTSRRLKARRTDTFDDIVEARLHRRWCVFDRVAVFSTAPRSSFLALLFELLLSFGVGEAKEQLHAIGLIEDAMIVLDHSFSGISCLEAGMTLVVHKVSAEMKHTERSQPLY